MKNRHIRAVVVSAIVVVGFVLALVLRRGVDVRQQAAVDAHVAAHDAHFDAFVSQERVGAAPEAGTPAPTDPTRAAAPQAGARPESGSGPGRSGSGTRGTQASPAPPPTRAGDPETSPPSPLTSAAPPPAETSGSEARSEIRVEQIRGEFRRVRAEFRECYEVILALEPARSGRLVFDIEVELDDETGEGVPLLHGVESEGMELEHVECFSDVIDTMHFPPPADDEGDRVVTYRLRYPVVLTAGQ